MPRDEALETIWPRLGADVAASNLHKAASYARRALGGRGAIVLRSGMVELAPEAEVTTDVERFERGDDSAYGGDLLPDDHYAEWAAAVRARLRRRRLDLMREHGWWEEVLREEPADEDALRALMRRHFVSGDRLAAARQLRLLRDELAALGMEPSAKTLALQRELTRGPAVRAARVLHAPLEGREREVASGSDALRRAAAATAPRCSCGRVGVRQDASDRGLAGRGRGARLPHPSRRRTRGGGPHAVRAAHRGARSASRATPGARGRTHGQRAGGAGATPAVGTQAATTEDAVNRHRLFSAVAQLLAEAASERGVVLAIDDLHAVDEASAALLHHLARSGAGERLLVVAALRDEPLPKAVALVRSRLLERGAAVEVALGPLSRAAIGAVARRAAGRPLAPAALASIERSSAGNPFFAEELAASVDAAGEVTVPPRLREIAARRLEQLEPHGERLLAALAVIDDGFTDADLRALAGGEPVDRALAAAEAAGVLEAVRARYRFRHALVRQELAARVPEAALRPTHADAAALLAADERPPEAVAHHLLRAGRARDAVPLLTQAAE
jgi:DNA-binding SARP family transcriptional activator